MTSEVAPGYPADDTAVEWSACTYSEHLIALAYFRSVSLQAEDQQSGADLRRGSLLNVAARAMARTLRRLNRTPASTERDAGPRRMMIDVGAFGGESFLPYVEMGWSIHAFEPDPRKYEELERLDAPGVRLHRAALSDSERVEAPWYSSAEMPSISTLAPFDPSHRRSATVRVTTLTRALDAKEVPSVDFLKVDAEGFDLPVLRGFPWHRLSPEVVLCEFEDRKTRRLGYSTVDLGDFLLARGYRVYLSEWHPIVRYGGSHRWRRIVPYPSELLEPNAWGNFIAVRPEGADRMARAIFDTMAAEHTGRLREIESLQKALGEIRGHLSERNESIQQLRDGIRRREEQIAQLKEVVNGRDAAIGSLREALADRNQSISRLREAVSDREDRLHKTRPTKPDL